MRISRRDFFKKAGGTALALALGGCKSRKPISNEEYKSTIQSIQKAGYSIDEKNSRFRTDSKTLLIYLPDVHEEDYARLQRKRIIDIDKAIGLDSIGLEGFVGEIDCSKISKLERERDKFYDKNTIPLFQGGKGVGYHIKEGDSPPLRLQKLRVKLEDCIIGEDMIYKNEYLKSESYNENKLSPLNEFYIALCRLFTSTPIKNQKYTGF